MLTQQTIEQFEETPPFNSAGDINSLVVELERYRRQSEWLALVNGLHARLAGAVDLPSMLEAFSVWLMPLVPHDLMAYENRERGRNYMFCSCHGPRRQEIMRTASAIFAADGGAVTVESGHFVRHFPLADLGGDGTLLVLRKGRAIGDYETTLVKKGLKILVEPLQRAIEYEDIYEQACRDALTGLVNRRVFEERLPSLMAQAARNGRPLTLACMDLDRFKQVNDTHGHAVGDMVLQRIAHTMSSMIRGCDILARMGGDEFMLIMPDTSIEKARILAERLCRNVAKLDLSPVAAGEVGVSIGLMEWDGRMDRATWLRQADEALYQAKAGGRSQVALAGSARAASMAS